VEETHELCTQENERLMACEASNADTNKVSLKIGIGHDNGAHKSHYCTGYKR
jgi:hypothetical protein